MIFSPILILVLGAVVTVCAAILRFARSYSFKALLGCAVALGVVVGTYFAADKYAAFGSRDALMSLGVFSVYGFICFALGALAWWYCSNWRDA